MATTRTEIANLALSHLGAVTLADVDTPTTVQGRLAQRYFDKTVDEVIADHPWKFATFRTTLTVDATAPAYDWSYRFLLPESDTAQVPFCLRVLGTSEDGNKEPWVVEGRYLLMNLSEVSITYLGRVVNPDNWAPLFTTALTYCLAAKLAYPITKSMSVRTDMMRAYAGELVRARAVNALEGPAKVVTSRTLLEVR